MWLEWPVQKTGWRRTWKPRLDLISKAVGSLSWMPFKKLDQPLLRNKEIDRGDLAGEPPAGKKSRATDFLVK